VLEDEVQPAVELGTDQIEVARLGTTLAFADCFGVLLLLSRRAIFATVF
jgi:hypothetical protein